MKEIIKKSDRIAIINGDTRISFTEMLQHIYQFSKVCTCNKGERILILSENREGWIYAFYGIWANQAIAVPIDAEGTLEDACYIMKDSKPSAIWVSKKKQKDAVSALEMAGIDIPMYVIDDYEFADASACPLAEIPNDENDTCIICYTSGTTGSPKGVMISYGNMFANTDAVYKHVHIYDENRRTLILLPLHHILSLGGTCVISFMCGGGVALCQSLSAPKLMQALQNGQVSIVVGVPRLWQMLYRGIKSKIDANAITRTLFKICEKLQWRGLSRVVFKSVRDKMGGKIVYLVSAGAALDVETGKGLKTLGLDVLEGYGMTEAAPMITFTRPDDIRPGCSGIAVPGCEVKIIDGEICYKGPNVMQGYYGRPEETAAIFDSEGFLHSGDLGVIDSEGHLTVTGRKKEIIVLSNGKNVNPNELEEKLEKYPDYVKEVGVTFADDKLVAIVVPAEDFAKGKSEAEIMDALRHNVMAPFNESVAPYKKVSRIVLSSTPLPRTRLEKLQRYKLQQML